MHTMTMLALAVITTTVPSTAYYLSIPSDDPHGDKMREYGIVDSGDSRELGIGAMTEARVASFFNKMVRAGVVKPTVDFRKSFTPQFINKRVGIELRPKN